MPKIAAWCLLLVIVSSCSSSKNSAQSQNSADLMGTWVHVFEEDSPGIKQYRPEGYSVGPARFRERVNFQKNGEVTMLRLAPNDAHQDATGRWEWKKGNILSIHLPDTDPIVWEVLEITNESLKIKH
ncbi:MAG: hypothetical protein AAFQ98_15315 [Bacteroidota bacterium]